MFKRAEKAGWLAFSFMVNWPPFAVAFGCRITLLLLLLDGERLALLEALLKQFKSLNLDLCVDQRSNGAELVILLGFERNGSCAVLKLEALQLPRKSSSL